MVDALIKFESQHSFANNATFVRDKGSHFTAEILKKLADLKGIKQRFGIAYSPFTMGTIERPHRETFALLRSLLIQHRLPVNRWSKILPVVEGMLNRLPRKQLGMRSPVRVAHNIEEAQISNAFNTIYIDEGFKTFERNKAEKEFKKIADYFADWHKRNIDIKKEFRTRLNSKNFTKHMDLNVGDWVMVAVPKQKRKSKIHFRWQGPAVIVKMEGSHLAHVKYRTENKVQQVHSCYLAFYSHSLEGVEAEVDEQYMYDADKWEIDHFEGLHLNPTTNEYELWTCWRGISSDEDTMEPLIDLYKQVPEMVVNFLTKQDNDLAKAALQRLRDVDEINEHSEI